MIVALALDRDIDLRLFSRYLTQSGVPHRINEEGEQQVVWVQTEEQAALVRSLYERLSRGEIVIEEHEREGPPPAPRGVPFLVMLKRAPLTAALVLVNLACYPAAMGVGHGQFSEWLRLMTFVAFEKSGDYLYFSDLGDTLASGQYWRLLSPMFLHFSVMHIVFNLLWVWEVGRRIEMVNGALVLLLVVVLTSLSANLTQYYLSGPSLFGGMSGVVFGLLGYAFVWSRLVPSRDMGLPSGVYVFMFVFLGLGFLGVLDLIVPGQMANGAHLGGLVAGLLAALPLALKEGVGGNTS